MGVAVGGGGCWGWETPVPAASMLPCWRRPSVGRAPDTAGHLALPPTTPAHPTIPSPTPLTVLLCLSAPPFDSLRVTRSATHAGTRLRAS